MNKIQFIKPKSYSLFIWALFVFTIGKTHAQQICMVSADFQTGENYIVSWESIADISLIDSVLIYRKQGVQSAFSQVGSVDVTSGATNFVDNTALTYDTTKYAIAYLYNDGTVSQRSLWHQAVVMNYVGSGEFIWTKYRIENQLDESYINGYEVLKDNLGLGAFLGLGGLLNSVLNYIDLTYILTPNARYVVEVALPTCNVIQKSNIHTSRSNIKTLTVNPATPSDTTVTNPILDNIEDDELSLSTLKGMGYSFSPNPANNQVTLVFDELTNVNSLSITNIQGRNVHYQNDISSPSISISVVDFPNGIYFIHVESKGVISSKRLIVRH